MRGRRSIQEILHDLGAIMQGGHFAFRSGHHGSTYVNKNAIFPHTRETSDLCAEIADHFVNSNVEVVAGPAMGGTIMSQWVAHHLFALTGKSVLSLYAEKETIRIPDPEGNGRLCFYETGRFVFGRGYENHIIGKNVLVVEDVVTTGTSVKEVSGRYTKSAARSSASASCAIGAKLPKPNSAMSRNSLRSLQSTLPRYPPNNVVHGDSAQKAFPLTKRSERGVFSCLERSFECERVAASLAATLYLFMYTKLATRFGAVVFSEVLLAPLEI